VTTVGSRGRLAAYALCIHAISLSRIGALVVKSIPATVAVISLQPISCVTSMHRWPDTVSDLLCSNVSLMLRFDG
jgi:hypothetical protein